MTYFKVLLLLFLGTLRKTVKNSVRIPSLKARFENLGHAKCRGDRSLTRCSMIFSYRKE
jgi:hypothetical protein